MDRHGGQHCSPWVASSDAVQGTDSHASPPPWRKWRPVLPVHCPPTSGGQVGARPLTTFCADGRQAAAAIGWRPRPPAGGGGGGAGGGPRPRAPRSPGPRSSSCSPPSWRGRPRQVRRRRRCHGLRGASPPAWDWPPRTPAEPKKRRYRPEGCVFAGTPQRTLRWRGVPGDWRDCCRTGRRAPGTASVRGVRLAWL